MTYICTNQSMMTFSFSNMLRDGTLPDAFVIDTPVSMDVDRHVTSLVDTHSVSGDDAHHDYSKFEWRYDAVKHSYITAKPYFISLWGEDAHLAFHQDTGRVNNPNRYTMVSCLRGARRFYLLNEGCVWNTTTDHLLWNGINVPCYLSGDDGMLPTFVKEHNDLSYIDIVAGQSILFRKKMYHATTPVPGHSGITVNVSCFNVIFQPPSTKSDGLYPPRMVRFTNKMYEHLATLHPPTKDGCQPICWSVPYRIGDPGSALILAQSNQCVTEFDCVLCGLTIKLF